MSPRERIEYIICRVVCAATLLSVVGCSKGDDGATLAGGEAITFEEYDFKDEVSSGSTRASLVTGFVSGDRFEVYAYSVAAGGTPEADAVADIMDGDIVTLSESGKWEYSPTKYWADRGNDVQFFAFMPDSVGSINDECYPPVLTYTMDEDATKHKDLLAAKSVYAEAIYSGVSFAFDHVLAAIGFSVKGSTSRKLTGVELKGVFASGTISYSSNGWSSSTGADVDNCTAGITATIPTSKDVAVNVTTDNGYIMAIPQTIPTTATVAITYESTSGGSSITREISIYSSSLLSWEKGKKYIYCITLSDPLSIELANWEDIESDDTQFDVGQDAESGFSVTDYLDGAATDKVEDDDGFDLDIYPDDDAESEDMVSVANTQDGYSIDGYSLSTPSVSGDSVDSNSDGYSVDGYTSNDAMEDTI